MAVRKCPHGSHPGECGACLSESSLMREVPFRYVVANPKGLPLTPGIYTVEADVGHPLLGIVTLTILSNVTEDGK